MRIRLLFIIGLMQCALSASSQTNYTDTLYDPQGSIMKACYFNKIDSVWICNHYYQNGKLQKMETLFINGFTPHGSTIGLNPNGKTAYSLNYKFGIMFGPFDEFFTNGKTKKTGHFYNGFKTGKWIEYDAAGSIIFEREYIMTASDSTYQYIKGEDRLVNFEITYGQPYEIKIKDKIMMVDGTVKQKFLVLEPRNKR